MSGASSRQPRYFTIGQVSKKMGLEPHVLRYWEKEFEEIRPRRISGRRLYRAIDVAYIRLIHHLLYKEGFTISGAKKRLKELKLGTKEDIDQYLVSKRLNTKNSGLINSKSSKEIDIFNSLREIKTELLKIVDMLK